MGKREKKLLIIFFLVLGLFTVYLYSVLFFIPALTEIREARKNIRELEREIKFLEKEEDIYNSLLERLKSIADAFLKQSDKYRFLEYISRKTSGAGLQLDSIYTKTGIEDEIEFISVHFQISGPPRIIEKFIIDLDSAPLFFALDSIRVSGDNPAGASLIYKLYLVN